MFVFGLSLWAQVTHERLLKADGEPGNWLTYSGNYSGHRYSALDQINDGECRTVAAALGVSGELAAEVRDDSDRCRWNHVPVGAAE